MVKVNFSPQGQMVDIDSRGLRKSLMLAFLDWIVILYMIGHVEPVNLNA